MISFIVIGRNEEKHLRKCLNSIYKTILFTNISQYEIIYVDSKSTDESIEIAGSFTEVKIFCIKGECNAAIARNIGANESKGNILFFIDGDMEIEETFLLSVLDCDFNLTYDFVSGQIIDVIDGIHDEARISNKYLPGGVFLIRKELWFLAKGMKTKYKTGEDLDLGLRLYKFGYSMIRKQAVITKHYTVQGLNRSRIWKMIWDKSSFYARSVLYREHFFNKIMYGHLWQVDKTFILLVSIIILTILFPGYLAIFISVYLIAIILRSAKQIRHISLIEFILYYAVFDLINLIFLFSFFPKAKSTQYNSSRNI